MPTELVHMSRVKTETIKGAIALLIQALGNLDIGDVVQEPIDRREGFWSSQTRLGKWG